MTRFSTKRVFDLLERLSMRFPKATGGLDDKIRYEEKISFVLTHENGKQIRGKNA